MNCNFNIYNPLIVYLLSRKHKNITNLINIQKPLVINLFYTCVQNIKHFSSFFYSKSCFMYIKLENYIG